MRKRQCNNKNGLIDIVEFNFQFSLTKLYRSEGKSYFKLLRKLPEVFMKVKVKA